MKIKTNTHKTYTLKVSKKELNAIHLAVALLWENEYTHQNWLDVTAPILSETADVLGVENEWT